MGDAPPDSFAATESPLGDRKGDSDAGLGRLKAAVRAGLFGAPSDPERIGRYRVVRRLGEGGMGVVYAGYDAELDREVAIKLVRADIGVDEAARARMRREAQVMARVPHPNVAHVYEVGEYEGQLYAVMELVAGQTMRAWARTERRSVAQIVSVHLEAGRALASAHERGVVHRDYKPDNVMVGPGERVRVVDFGLARARGSEDGARPSSSGPHDVLAPELEATVDAAASPTDLRLTATGAVVGTPAYMAPEQLAGRDADPRSDQFAFCVALYEGLYGERPFVADSFPELTQVVASQPPRPVDPAVHGVSRALHAAILRGLQKDPAERHAEMQPLLDSLRAEIEPHARRVPGRGLRRALAVGVAGLAAFVAWSMLVDPVTLPMASSPASDLEPAPAWLVGSDLPETLPEPLADDELGVTIHRLSNGLTVYIATRPDTPRIAAQLVIRAGARDEPATHRGVARLLAPLTLQGSDRLGTLDFATEKPLLERRNELLRRLDATDDPAGREAIVEQIRAILVEAAPVQIPDEAATVLQELGIEGINVYMTTGSTGYVADVPAPRLEAWAALQAEMVARPVFRGFLHEVSRSLTMSIFFQQRSPPIDAAVDMLFEGDVPDGALTAVESLARMPYGPVVEFHERFYRPNNAAVILVGDVTPERALPMLERAFGEWRPQPLPLRDRDLPSLEGRHQLEVASPVPFSASLVWRVADLEPRLRARLDTLRSVLSGRRGLLQTTLVDRGLATFATALPGNEVFTLWAGAAEGTSDEELVAAIDAVLADLAAGRIDPGVVEAAIASGDVARDRNSHRNAAAGTSIAFAYAEGRAWADVVRSRRVGTSMHEELAELARVLQRAPQVLVRRREGNATPPKVEPPSLPARSYGTGRSELAAAVTKLPASELEPRFLVAGRDFAIHDVGAARLVTAQRPGHAFSLWLRWPLGWLEDAAACDAVTDLVEAGRAGPSGRRFADEWLDLAAQVRPRCTPHAIEVVFDAPYDRRDELVASVRRWYATAEIDLDDAEARWARRARLDAESRRLPPSAQSTLEQYAMRGEAGARRRLEELRARPTGASVQAFAARLLRVVPDLAYVGPDAAGIVTAIAPFEPGDAPSRIPVRYREVDEPTIVWLALPHAEMASIGVIVPQRSLDERGRLLADLYDEYLIGQGAGAALRMVRDRVEQPFFRAGGHVETEHPDDEDAIALSISITTTSATDAIAAVLEAMARVPTREEVEQARARLEAQYRSSRISTDEIHAAVRRWSAHGHATDPRIAKWSGLATVTYEELVAFIEAIDRRGAIVTLLAPQNGIDPDALQKLGTLERIPPETLGITP